MVSDRRDRGQVLLVGGIAIAVVILGTMVVLNGLKFTDTLGAQTNSDELRQTERTQRMVVAHTATLSDRVQNETTLLGFAPAVRENVSTFSRHYSAFTFSDSDVAVNVTYNETASAGTGTYLAQNYTTPPFPSSPPPTSKYVFDGPPGGAYANDNNWTVATDVTRHGPFNITFDEFPGSGATGSPPSTYRDEFQVNATNGTHWWQFRVAEVSSGTWKLQVKKPGEDTPTDIDPTGAAGSLTESPGGDTPVWVDLSEGCYGTASSTKQCSEDLILGNGLDGPYTIEFSNIEAVSNDRAEGTYKIATDSTRRPSSIPCSAGPTSNPCNNPIPANVNLDVRIVQPSVSYQRSIWLNRTEVGS